MSHEHRRVSLDEHDTGGEEELSVRPLLRWLLLVIVVLVVVGPTALILRESVPAIPGALVDLDDEASLPTTFSIVLWALAALVFVLVGALERTRGTGGTPYLVFAGVFTYIVLDEGAELHERLNPVASAFIDTFPSFPWVLPGAVIAAVVGVLLLRLARRIPGVMRRRLIVAGAVFLLGAVVVEVAAGTTFTAPPADWDPAEGKAPQSPVFYVLTAVEEGLEMCGALLALRAGLLGLRFRRGPGRLIAETRLS